MQRIIIVALLFLTAIAAFPSGTCEVRAVWLTTNGGLDWPGRTYSPDSQKRQMIEMLDKLKDANFNLVIFQVQANGDVLWKSKIQPVMESVTGDGSKGLDYDVCKFVIDECHKRGMECHAWVVPFRIGSKKLASRYASNKVKHPAKSQSKLCVNYNGTMYLDPGNTGTRKYLLSLYEELVRNYDFDGINLDYTRYPGKDFPDDVSFGHRKNKKLTKAEWRRNNINLFVAELYGMAKSLKPNILVGSAPIGTYKNVENFKNATAYDSFQQDPGQWIADKCHDIVIPQMYWDEKAGFSANLKTWKSVALPACQLVVGLAPYKMMDSGWSVEQVLTQIDKIRKAGGVGGVCFFRAEHVLGKHAKAKALYGKLKDDVFKMPAELPWRVAEVSDADMSDEISDNPFLQ